MQTECNSDQLEFEGCGRRRVVAAFDGGRLTSDAGGLLLREADRVIGLIDRVAGCFSDGRSQKDVVHRLGTLVGQRIVAIALGYEDLNDHDDLRHDPVLALFSDRLEPRRADCAALAGKSTLNRLEHAPVGGGARYHKIDHDAEALAGLFVDLFLDAHRRAPKRITLDLDATDDPLHGDQEGRFFHGYYGCYCYLPLYIFSGRHLLAAKLRPANIDAAAGATDEVERIVGHIRKRWPKVKILLRADSGFAREALMAWCEANRVDYVFGLARNERLVARLEAELAWAAAECARTGKPQRRFTEFFYTTRKSWSRRRRVVAKAEHLPKGANPRFIVSSLAPSEIEARVLYERVYCARGEMENRIKEQQLDLFADRTSAATMRANQLRLWLSSFAYVLIAALRRIALKHTRLAAATCGTIRLKLLKIGAVVRVSVRRIKIALASACPYAHEFALAHARLRRRSA
ncbi:MAG: IS1380 family transposase [Alphaproteobacteria bacterium]